MSIVQVIVVCSSLKAKTLSKPGPVQTGIKVCPQGIPVWTGFTVYMNIALRRFLHNHGNIVTEGSPKPGLCPTLISNDFEGSL